MKRGLLIIFVMLVIVAGVIYFWYPQYIEDVKFYFSPNPRPLSFVIETVPTPVLVSTAEPTSVSARVIPPPEYIPTLDVVKDLIQSKTPATLQLSNDWSSTITLDFDGMKVVVAPGNTETKQFPPGDFKYTTSTEGCGSAQTSEITLKANETYSLNFYCSSGGIFGDQVGKSDAVIEIHNNSSLTLTFSINNKDYQIPPGTMEIHLAPGTYSYSASAPNTLPTAPKTVVLTPGDHVLISYTIY